MGKLRLFTASLLSMAFMGTMAQDANSFVHKQSDGYEWPTDAKVLEKLDKWQDKKFGVLFHWGLYTQAQTVESWALCSEDWITRPIDSYEEYKKWYWGHKDKFNPTRFNPEQWADVMEQAGMKYMIFTTKHHEGFCMYDSKYTDFSIANGPFADNPKKDVARYVFDAFRNKDFMIGCYFSKPDWHYEYYWNKYYATPDRKINYKKKDHMDWWKKYQDYSYNQMHELMTNYGDMDILWLDGGWEKGEDVGVDSLLQDVRSSNQPGLICVDRTIGGRNENYQTPEQTIPKEQINHPWETCLTLGGCWAWMPGDSFKSANQVVNILAEITAKGGSLALGVGPTPEGIIHERIVKPLLQIGEWLKVNGKAIYATRTTPVYHDGNVWFTADKDKSTLYAICTVKDGEEQPSTIEWKGNLPVGKMRMLDGSKSVKYRCVGDKVIVSLPKGIKGEAVALSFKTKGNTLK